MRRPACTLIALFLVLTQALTLTQAQTPPAPKAAANGAKAKAATPAVFPPFLDCVFAGQRSLRGKLSAPAAAKDFKVERNYLAVPLDGDPVVDPSGFFVIKLKLAQGEFLRSNQGIQLSVGKASVVRVVDHCETPFVISGAPIVEQKPAGNSTLAPAASSTPATVPAPIAQTHAAAPPAEPPADTPASYIIEPLTAGAKTLKVQLFVPGTKVTEVQAYGKKLKASIEDPDHNLVSVVTLLDPLIAGQGIRAIVSTSGPTAEVVVGSATAMKGPATLLNAPRDGDTKVTGHFWDSTVTAATLKIDGTDLKDTDIKLTIEANKDFTIAFTDSTKKFVKDQKLIVTPNHGEPSAEVKVLAPKPECLPALITAPSAGDFVVKVTVRQPAKSFKVSINGKALDKPVDVGPKPTDTAAAKGPIAWEDDHNAGKYSIKLENPVTLNQSVQAVALDDKGNAQCEVSNAISVVIGLKPPTVEELKEGAKTVSGKLNDNGDHVRVTVLDHHKAFKEEKVVALDAGTKNFVAGLTSVLAEDDTVRVTSMRGTGDAAAESDPVEQRVETAEYNWGRVRAYFSLGANTSKDDSNFTKVRPYLSLNVDKNWFSSVHCVERPDLTKALAIVKHTWSDGESNRLHDALTELQTAAAAWEKAQKAHEAKTMTDAEYQNVAEVYQRSRAVVASILNQEDERLQEKYGRMGPIQLRALRDVRLRIDSDLNYRYEHEDWKWRCDRNADAPNYDPSWYVQLNTYFEARLQNAQSLAINNVSSTTLKDSDKVANFEFGIYAPFSSVKTSWKFDGQRQALFIAPLFKGGIETVPVTTPVAGQVSLDSRDAFKFLSGGVRLGHYRAFPNSHSVAPVLISWVDFTWGRWDRMLRGIYPPYSVPMRFEATGRLKIPYSPFTIGFTANTGPGHDEFSLFGGTRFDLSRILAKIAPVIK